MHRQGIGREGIEGECMREHRDQRMYGYSTGRKPHWEHMKSAAECKCTGISKRNERANPLK